MERISPHIQKYILQPENSWIEKLDTNDKIDIGDINTHMDLFFVLSGAIEFTMREDPIHRARKRGLSQQSNASLVTESEYSFNSQASMVRKPSDNNQALASSN